MSIKANNEEPQKQTFGALSVHLYQDTDSVDVMARVTFPVIH